ncbi:amino acid permease domain-containing protein [Ditylenchus destructor]|uniref:Solute carrier family 12 member 9 n=1 Tax=Ditylenchus destructor TaxID=166010 RepID=A0AAD4NAU5_9BILA|nr:amino acid permease domain-containing protein [Ditylenchus destructor]
MDEERRTQISTQSTKRLPSYGILENGVGNGAAASIRVADIGLENLPNVNGNGSGTPNATATASEFDSVMSKRNGLSTMSGVFAPVTISMFSALLFLRMGFAAGQLGFMMTVAELLLAYSIILLTVLSLCAVSSNGAVEGGGVYYMISRTLGPEFGGSIGALFFVANVFSCALYISGFTEALSNVTGLADSYGGKFIHCVLVSIIILFLCLLGAEMFAKTALLALVVVVAAYGSFLFTVFVKAPTDIMIPKDNTMAYSVPSNATNPDSEKILNLNQTLTAKYTSFSVSTFTDNFFTKYTYDYTTGRTTDFAFMFAIIFSGVTGLMAGANMSGELARPNVSIPRGTLQAVFATLLTYILTAFLLCLTCHRDLLQADYLVMVDINTLPSLILLGIFAATFFSSMSNMIGASRVLNRLAQDKLFGLLLQPATVEFGPSGNPVISVVISWLCVVLVFMVGTMNRIAKMTSIFFLLSYMGVNVACLALELTSAPNFRPNFKYFSWHSCALGAISTITMMLVIDASMSAVAIVILMLLIMILHYQAPIGSWGSISQALIYHQVRKYLLLLDSRKDHVKFWRPQMLLLVNKPATCCPLMDFVNDIKKSGLYVIGHVQRGSMESGNGGSMDPLQQVYPYWLSLVDYLRLKAFVELTLTENVRIGIQQLIRLSGMGAMKPNTVVLGFHESEPSQPILSETHLLKDLKFSKIGRIEVVEYFTAGDFVPKELNVESSRLTTTEYVQTLHDIMNLNKNLCLARHFGRFDRESMLKQDGKRHIDVWPSHLFKPEENGLRWDNSSLFVLQLACILSMSSKWKNAVLRVFICVDSLQDMHYQEIQLKNLLEQLRINAKSVMVPWDHVVSQVERTETARKQNIAQFPNSFVKAVNEMIRRNSKDTAVCFLNLPLPPALTEDTQHESYLQSLRLLTQDLPPTFLVHGLSSVISTAL